MTKLTEKEAKRVLEIAFSSKRDTGGLSLEELEQSAGELGVAKERIAEAHKQMREEQTRSRAARKKLIVAASVVAVVVGAGAGISNMVAAANAAEAERKRLAAVEAGRPKRFTGVATPHFTSEVKNETAVDRLDKIRVLEMRSVTLYVQLSGLQHKHRTRAELRGPDGSVIDQQVVQITGEGEPYYVWYPFPVSWHWKPGTYTAHVFADDVEIAKKDLAVELGLTKLATASQVTDSAAVDVRDVFSAKNDAFVFTHIHFDYVKGGGGRLRWTWLAPDGSTYETESLVIHEVNGVWNAWDSIALNHAPPGKWKAKIELEDTLLGEVGFTVE